MPFIDISSSQWNSFLETGLHDLYHLPEYTALDAVWMKGEPLGWTDSLDNCNFLIPLIRRSINNLNNQGADNPYYDLVSPYGYPGLMSLKTLSAYEAFSAFKLFHAEASEAGYISSFIRLNPFLNTWQLPALTEFLQYRHGITFSIDLKALGDAGIKEHTKTSGQPDKAGQATTAGQSEIAGQLMDSFSLNHRRNLRRLHHQGYSVVINAPEYLPLFYQAYTATMIRHHASPRYMFTNDYFNRLNRIAGEHMHFLAVLSPNGEFTCGGLFSVFGRTMQYLFGATVESAIHQSPSKLMIEKAITVGVNHGAEVLHLGGGASADLLDGVYRFKQGFTHQQHAYSCLHFIHRPEIYHLLEHSIGSYCGEVLYEKPTLLYAGEAELSYGENSGFFPSYRASEQ